MKALTTSLIPVLDLLDAARTIPVGEICTCNWLEDWIPAADFLAWAQQGLAGGGAHGLSDAITYAKRAVASRIDALALFNHLRPILRSSYPRRMEALQEIGIDVPEVVHDLVIDPRNDLEHDY